MSGTRRSFLTAASAVTVGLGLPGVFRRAALAAPRADEPGGRQTVLVVIELTGGNDGLNTVIPLRDPEYARARPTLKQPAASVKKINADLAFHPALGGFADLLESSKLAVVQGVGYPNPNRSHFESMDIWHKATAAPDQQYGWLGRAAARFDGSGRAMHVGGGEPPLALLGPAGYAPSVQSLDQYQLRVGEGGEDAAARRSLIEDFAAASSAADNELLGEVRASARETYASAARLRQVARGYDTPVTYPDTGLSRRLRLIAQLIDAGVPERIYYTALPGFDTHAAQLDAHARLLAELADALAAFQKDITHHGHGQRVLAMTFSEFGRRVRENGSAGTDHGVAGPMFLIGDAVRPGPVGAHPSLTDLDNGDLKFHTDFRRVYATLLDQWLGIPSAAVLGAEYPALDLLAQRTNGSGK